MQEIYKYMTIVLLIALVLSLLNKHFEKGNPKEYPYKQKNILTEAEKAFYEVLKKSVPDGYLLFAKVRLWDIIDTTTTNNKAKYTNQIRAKHIDFLICDGQTKPILAIELDDKSHSKENRKARDEFINNALDAAQVKLLRQPCKKRYDIEEIKKAIEDKLRPIA